MTTEILAAQLERLQAAHWNVAHVCDREKEILMLAVLFASRAVEDGVVISCLPAINWREMYKEWAEEMRRSASGSRVVFSRLYSTSIIR